MVVSKKYKPVFPFQIFSALAGSKEPDNIEPSFSFVIFIGLEWACHVLIAERVATFHILMNPSRELEAIRVLSNPIRSFTNEEYLWDLYMTQLI